MIVKSIFTQSIQKYESPDKSDSNPVLTDNALYGSCFHDLMISCLISSPPSNKLPHRNTLHNQVRNVNAQNIILTTQV